MKNVVIAGYVRSPFHFASKGKLARIRPDDLAGVTDQVGRERRGVATEAVVIMAGPSRMPCPISRPSWAVAVRWCSRAVRTAASGAPTPTPG